MSLMPFLCIGALMYVFSIKATVRQRYCLLLASVALLEFLNLRGYLIPFGGGGVRANFLAELILLIYSVRFVYKDSIKLDRPMLLLMMVLLLWGILGIGREIVDPYEYPIINQSTVGSWDEYYLGINSKEKVFVSSGFVMLLYVKFAIFLFEMCVIKSALKPSDLLYTLAFITKTGQVLIVLGVLEFFIKYAIVSPELWESICHVVFGGDVDLQSRNMIALSGIEQEPSHFVLALFYLFLFMLIQNSISKTYTNIIKYQVWRFVVIFILLLASGGFSAFWVISFLLFIILLRHFDISRFNFTAAMKIMLIFYLVFLGGVYIVENVQVGFIDETIPYHNRFDELLVSMTDLFVNRGDVPSIAVSSTFVRLASIVSTIRDVLERPLWGLGIGIQTSHGAFANLLSDFGFIGITLLLLFVNAFRNSKIRMDSILLLLILFVFGLPFGLREFPYNVFYILIFEFTTLYSTPKAVVMAMDGKESLCKS